MVIYPKKYPDQDNFSDQFAGFEYDLQEEKRIIENATEEIKKELLDKWKRAYSGAQLFPSAIRELHPLLIDFLLSFDHTVFYNELGQKFNLNQEQRNMLPLVVWNICKNKKWETTESSLQINLNLLPQISSQIASLINQNILSRARELANKPIVPKNEPIKKNEFNSNLSLTIPEALRQYPDIGEQLITGNRIKIQNFPEPARPSLKNWLADYVMLIGRENRNAVKRSSYLFQSENGKNLSSSDRHKLAFILKSLDENTPITINKNTKQVIFPQLQETSIPAFEKPSPSPVEPKNNIQSVQFSYPQKSVTQRTSPPIIIPKPEPKINLGPNVVNLKE